MDRTAICTFLLRVGLALALLIVAAPGAQAVSVAVVPADTTVSVGDTFTLRVQTDAFPDLKAYQLIFGFNPGVLQFLDAGAGDVLTGTGRPFTVQVLPDVTLPADTAWVDCAMLLGSTAGPGVLIYFQFKALAVGDSPIPCDGVDFRDSFNNSTLPACSPGMVHVLAATATEPMTWGRLKTVYR